jgi:hypothetical protein
MRLQLHDQDDGTTMLTSNTGEPIEGQLVLTEHSDHNAQGDQLKAWVTVTLAATALDRVE